MTHQRLAMEVERRKARQRNGTEAIHTSTCRCRLHPETRPRYEKGEDLTLRQLRVLIIRWD